MYLQWIMGVSLVISACWVVDGTTNSLTRISADLKRSSRCPIKYHLSPSRQRLWSLLFVSAILWAGLVDYCKSDEPISLKLDVLGTGHWSEGSLVRKLYSRTFRGGGNPNLHTLPHPFPSSHLFPSRLCRLRHDTVLFSWSGFWKCDDGSAETEVDSPARKQFNVTVSLVKQAVSLKPKLEPVRIRQMDHAPIYYIFICFSNTRSCRCIGQGTINQGDIRGVPSLH